MLGLVVFYTFSLLLTQHNTEMLELEMSNQDEASLSKMFLKASVWVTGCCGRSDCCSVEMDDDFLRLTPAGRSTRALITVLW